MGHHRFSEIRNWLLADATQYRRKNFRLFVLLSAVCLSLSQLSSWLIYSFLAQGESVVIMSDLLHFTHIRNMGGVFGMAQGRGWLFALLSVLLISALIWYLLRGRNTRIYEYLFFGFVAGGGLSNITDRLVYGSVIDFIDVQGIPYWNYIFNTADVFIHVGLWPMLFIGLFWHRDESQSN